GAVRAPLPHDSAEAHVSGGALYADDLAEASDLLHLAFGQSPVAHGTIRAIDLSAVRAAPGVEAVFTAADIPGHNDVSPVAGDDRLFADGEVVCVGQALFVVAATSATAARRAARLATLDIKQRPAFVTIAQAREAGSLIEATQRMARGDADAALERAPHRLTGSLELGGQEHFYLEGQVALATP
uniref:molybdopterin cofactor-binding domain-containing protein n=1 Tax=Pseudomonas lurida TaxID=244566 RepID=UPI0030D6E205